MAKTLRWIAAINILALTVVTINTAHLLSLDIFGMSTTRKAIEQLHDDEPERTFADRLDEFDELVDDSGEITPTERALFENSW
jgi:hypothetical protein